MARRRLPLAKRTIDVVVTSSSCKAVSSTLTGVGVDIGNNFVDEPFFFVKIGNICTHYDDDEIPNIVLSLKICRIVRRYGGQGVNRRRSSEAKFLSQATQTFRNFLSLSLPVVQKYRTDQSSQSVKTSLKFSLVGFTGSCRLKAKSSGFVSSPSSVLGGRKRYAEKSLVRRSYTYSSFSHTYEATCLATEPTGQKA